MAFSNNMTKLLNKIENRLGVKMLNLPDKLSKDKWAEEVIIADTLSTFSRYFPNQIEYQVTKNHPKKDGWYYIDEDFIEGAEILGVKDLSWSDLGRDSLYAQQEMGYGTLDVMSLSAGFSPEDIGMVQMRADYNSLFNNKIYVDFVPPNKFSVKGRLNIDFGKGFSTFKVLLLIKHADSLTTITPTKMEIFEKLAISDTAAFLYNNLKYYDGLQTVYASIELKLEDLKSKADDRDSIIQELKDSYVSSSNDFAPMIMTV